MQVAGQEMAVLRENTILSFTHAGLAGADYVVTSITFTIIITTIIFTIMSITFMFITIAMTGVRRDANERQSAGGVP
jgi:hypothetical protein